MEYKGSISFRIVSDRKLHKRAGRRKSSAVANGDVSLLYSFSLSCSLSVLTLVLQSFFESFGPSLSCSVPESNNYKESFAGASSDES